jgi:hypothetical protein
MAVGGASGPVRRRQGGLINKVRRWVPLTAGVAPARGAEGARSVPAGALRRGAFSAAPGRNQRSHEGGSWLDAPVRNVAETAVVKGSAQGPGRGLEISILHCDRRAPAGGSQPEMRVSGPVFPGLHRTAAQLRRPSGAGRAGPPLGAREAFQPHRRGNVGAGLRNISTWPHRPDCSRRARSLAGPREQ